MDGMLKRKRASDGFTLVEMIIVVTFISILMSIAIPFYLNFQMKAKEAEARSGLGAIRTCFITYFAESNHFSVGNVGTLAYTSGDNTGTPYGASSLARGANRRWNPTTSFSVLGYNAEGAVFFNYSMEENGLTGNAASFTAMASADLNRDTLVSHYYLNEDAVTIYHAGDRF